MEAVIHCQLHAGRGDYPHPAIYLLCGVVVHSTYRISLPNFINWEESARMGGQHLLSPFSGLATN